MPSFAVPACRRRGPGIRLLPIILFISLLATSAAPRLTPLFFAVISVSLIGAAIRQGTRWPELLPRTPALAACLLLAAYVFLNATWSADRSAGLSKPGTSRSSPLRRAIGHMPARCAFGFLSARPQTSARSTRSAASCDGRFGARPILTRSAQA